MKATFVTIILTIITVNLFAQAPQSFQYQAVVRDASGTAIISQLVNFQISIISGSITGTVEYVEIHTASTNAFGVVTLEVGSGSSTFGTFPGIIWGNILHFIKVEADPTGGTSYLDMGTTQLLSVPYSLYSEKAGNIPTYSGGTGINVTGTTISNTAPNQTVTLSQGGATTVTGTYPNFTISSNDLNSGTPGGLNKTIQYNNSGSFSGDTALAWDNANKRLGIGLTNPSGRVVIKGSALAPSTEPLFEVKNKAGQTVFVVYEDSVNVFVNDDAIQSNRGGFAVSGRNNAKSFTNKYMHVTPDNSKIWTKDTLKGFGVENINGTNKTSYMQMTPDNYFIGHLAGNLITTGKYNSFIGYQSGYKNNTGNKNYFIGYRSGYNNLTGISNIFIGDSAGFYNVNGMRNVFIGNQSGLNNMSGKYNVFLGFNSGFSNNADYNVFLGYETGKYNTTGSWNVFSGFQAGYSNLDGYSNIANGNQSLFFNTSGDQNVAIGNGALYTNNGDFNLACGNWALYHNTTGNNNISIGINSMYQNLIGNYNVAVGLGALYSNTSNANVSVGSYTLFNNSTGSGNTATGHFALYNNTQGYSNSAFGSQALFSNTTGISNTALGDNALLSNITGDYNTAIGKDAFSAGSNYSNSTAIGYNAGMNASNKVRIGNGAVTVIEGQVAYTFPSDGRFKNNVTEEVKGLDFLTRLRPIVYNFDTKRFDLFLMKDLPDSLRELLISKIDYSESSSIRQTGFIAQEVEQAAKESGYDFNGVHKPSSDNENYSVAYSLFTVPLVKAVQELNSINDNQQLIIDKQSSLLENQNIKINELQKQIDELKLLIKK